MVEENTLTRTELQRATGAPSYTIDYLRDCKRLPTLYESRGRGYPTLYHPDAVKVVEDHLNKGHNRVD